MNAAHPLVLAIALSATACGAESSRATTADGIAGYTHSLARSWFVLGTPVRTTTTTQFVRVEGSLGTFATATSGATTATPDRPVPDGPEDVFPGGGAAQDPAVRSYFVGAGVPAEQVESVTDDPTGKTTSDGTVVVVTEYSILHRAYDGVPIEDSMAWALLSSAGQSLSEQVYWPAIGADVVAQLRAFQSILADPRRSATFFGALPAASTSGQLVIHHTPWDWPGPFQAVPCYRAQWPGASLCFGPDGRPVRLVSEVT